MSENFPEQHNQSTNGSSSKDLLLNRQLAAVLNRLRPERLLLMARETSRPNLPELPKGRWVELRSTSAAGCMICRTDDLPFSDDAFDAVIVSDLLKDGNEAQLHEAQRVLKTGGVLLICGRGRLNRAGDLPLLKVTRLCQKLQQSDFDIRSFEIIGLLGRNSISDRAWLRTVAGWSHSILIRARHTGTPGVTTLKFERPRAAGIRTALDSVSREAV